MRKYGFYFHAVLYILIFPQVSKTAMYGLSLHIYQSYLKFVRKERKKERTRDMLEKLPFAYHAVTLFLVVSQG